MRSSTPAQASCESASHVRLGALRITVSDDGVGGATESGSGLQGLRDRLARRAAASGREPTRRRHDGHRVCPDHAIFRQGLRQARSDLAGNSEAGPDPSGARSL